MQRNGAKSKHHQQSVPQELRPEIKAAVNDLMTGTPTDSATEWLQREFTRLMHREAQYRRNNPSAKTEDQ